MFVRTTLMRFFLYEPEPVEGNSSAFLCAFARGFRKPVSELRVVVSEFLLDIFDTWQSAFEIFRK